MNVWRFEHTVHHRSGKINLQTSGRFLLSISSTSFYWLQAERAICSLTEYFDICLLSSSACMLLCHGPNYGSSSSLPVKAWLSGYIKVFHLILVPTSPCQPRPAAVPVACHLRWFVSSVTLDGPNTEWMFCCVLLCSVDGMSLLKKYIYISVHKWRDVVTQ